MSDLSELIARVEAASGADNALDIAVDIALFTPDARHKSARANHAGTKLVYERHVGASDTYWAVDHTLTADRRSRAIALLRALQSQEIGH